MRVLYGDRSGEDLPAGLSETVTDALRLAYRAVSKTRKAKTEVSLSLVTAEEIHALNMEYRQVDRATDVLSFAARESVSFRSKALRYAPLPLGDIVICPKTAKAQAAEYGHSLTREMAFLAVHGLLHLLGYNHETPEEEKRMFNLQEKILEQAGINR